MKRYRKVTRAPREIEQTEAIRERDELRATVAVLRTQVRELREEAKIYGFEVERLLNDKIGLAQDLREARATIALLTGDNSAMLPCGPGSHFGTKRMLEEWN